jgi:glucosamine--fructose-6-phosphate aminotransferase (isomerizing)
MPDSSPTTTHLERQIRSQPEELARLLSSGALRAQIREASEGLKRAHRIWLVGTGTSQHAAELGAAMLNQAGRAATPVPSMQFVSWAPVLGPKDVIVTISHTGETAYARSARTQAFLAGLNVLTFTRTGSGLPDTIETVPKETSETYTVSYTATLLALAMLAASLGAEGLTDDALAAVPDAVAAALADPGTEAIPPSRLLVLTGAGPASVTAREGALKVREASRSLAEGFDAEYLLHGSAVPLTADDHLVALGPPDDDGLTEGVATAAEGAGLRVTRLSESAALPAVLAQIPLTVRLQLLALRFARERGQDPDTVIVGSWADERLWALGGPHV